jgi:hypothetical protein
MFVRDPNLYAIESDELELPDTLDNHLNSNLDAGFNPHHGLSACRDLAEPPCGP